MTAAASDSPPSLDLREQIVHIDQMIADTRRKQQELRLAPWQIATTMLGGAAACMAAGAALVKLLGG